MPSHLTTPIPPHARLTYLAISAIIRDAPRRPFRPHRPAVTTVATTCRHLSSSHRQSSNGNYYRSDFVNQPFTSDYEAREQTPGPLSGSSTIGAPRITPRLLKDHLDQFVVGQERAKKALATAVYNHYQRIQELQRRDDEEDERVAQDERRRMADVRRHPVEGRESELKQGIAVPSLTRDWRRDEDEFPGQQTTVNMPPNVSTFPQQADPQRRTGGGPYEQPGQHQQQSGLGSTPLADHTPLTIEKSNILLLGPSGVGKTLMAKTLARVLEVPFSMSDCTPFTQAGYIGEDAEVCVQRLLATANYDVARAERGIICLDELDKIATAKVSHGKDVSGEGVQQALLKIIEGTTVQVQAKQERSSGGGGGGSSPPRGGQGGGAGGGYTGGGGHQSAGSGGSGGPGQKGDVYNVKTDNILFICAGAFNGLHKMILDRISKGSIGFGATVRSAPGGNNDGNQHETILEGEDELFETHLPFYDNSSSSSANANNTKGPSSRTKRTFNTLDLVEPQDLQKYGLIPELVGRIPLSCALSSLDVPALVQVLTEPRNSLLQQYTQLFALSSIDLRITTPALHSIALTASKMGIGARGLRTVMERLLADAMFETPGTGVKFVVVTEAVAERKERAGVFYRGEGTRVLGLVAKEEEEWEERVRREKEGEDGEGSEWERRARNNSVGGAAKTFEEYREKATAAGF